MHVGTDFLKLPPVTGQYWSLFQCSMLGTGGTCAGLSTPLAELPVGSPWGERNRFRTLRRDVAPAGALNEPMSLSQSEVMSYRQYGVMGGGREPFGQVDVLKVSHHGAIPVAWSRAMNVLERRLKFLPDLKLFAILSPLRNLKCLFRNSGLITLSSRQQV